MAGRFEFEVGSRFDQAGIDAFVQKVQQAIGQISSAGGDVGAVRSQALGAFASAGQAAFSGVQAGPGAAAQLEEMRRAAQVGLNQFRQLGASGGEVNAATSEMVKAMRVSARSLLDRSNSDKTLAAQSTELTRLSRSNIAPGWVGQPLLRVSGRPADQVGLGVSDLAEAQRRIDRAKSDAYRDLTPEGLVERQTPRAQTAGEQLKADQARLGIPDTGQTEGELSTQIVVAKRAQAAAEKLKADEAALGIVPIQGATTAQREVEVKVRQRLLAEEGQLAAATRTRELLDQEGGAIAQRMAADRILNREINSRVSAEIRARTAAGEPGFGGTRFQNFQAAVASRQGGTPRLPDEFPSLGQFAANKAITTAGFAASGALLYGGFQAVKDMLSETTKLQVQFAQLEQQFKATDKAGEFPAMRQAILDIGRETGVLTTDVAGLAPYFLGAFGGGVRAAHELRDAVIGIRVGAFKKEDAANIGIALKDSFGTAIKDVTDEGLHLRDVFGPAADEILRGVGSLAPVAHEVGLTFKETSTIIAAAAAATASPATAVAEGFNRIIPKLQEQAAVIVGIYRQNPLLAGKAPQIGGEFSTGDTGKVLTDLIRDSDKLTQTEKERVFAAVGGRREAQYLISAFNQQALIVKELDDNTSHAGRTQDEFARVQETIATQLARVREQFRQLGQDLLKLGLADLARDAAIAFGFVVTVISTLLQSITKLNDLTGGWAVRLAEVYAVARYLVPLIQSLTTASVGNAAASVAGAVAPGLAGRLGAGAAAGGVAARGSALPGAFLRGGEAAAGAGIAASESTGLLASVGGYAGLGIGAAVVLGPELLSKFQQYRAHQDAEIKKIKETLDKEDTATLKAVVQGRRDSLSASLRLLLAQSDQDPKPVAQAGITQRTQVDDLGALTAGKQSLSSKEQAKAIQAAIQERTRLHGSALERVGQSLFEDTTGVELGPNVKTRSNEISRLAQDAFRKTGDDYAAIIEGVKADDANAKALAKAILDAYKKRPGYDQTVLAGKSKVGDQLKAVTEAEAKRINDVTTNVSTAVQDYQSGDSSLAAAIQKLQGIIDNQELLRAPDGSMSDADRTVLGSARKAQADLISKEARGFLDLQTQLAEAGGAGPEVNVANLTKFLQDPRNTSVTERAKAAHDLLTGIAKVANETGKAQPFLEDARQALAGEQIHRSADLTGFFDRFVGEIGLSRDDLESDVAALVGGGKSVRESVDSLLEKRYAQIAAAHGGTQFRGGFNVAQSFAQRIGAARAAAAVPGVDITIPTEQAPDAAALKRAAKAAADLAKANAHGDPILTALADRKSANDDLTAAIKAKNGPDQDTAQAAVVQSEDALQKAYEDLAKSRDDLAKAEAHGDPVKVAQADLGAANRELAKALEIQKGLQAANPGNPDVGAAAVAAAQAKVDVAKDAGKKAASDLALANIELLKAQAGDDPVALARLGQQQADQAAKDAVGEAAKLSAAAQKIQADRTLRNAIDDTFAAHAELLIALANATGDGVSAAQAAADEARRKFEAAVANGAGKGEIDRLQAQLISANADVTKNQVSTQERNIDFALQVGQISAQQAIAQLNGLLTLVQGNEAETQAILLKINALKKDLGRDLQFGSVPQDLKLPTLYEARRLNQSPGGGGYQDNRRIELKMDVSADTDFQAAFDQFHQLANQPSSQFGTVGSLYLGN